jgi:urease accessory protein
MKKRIPRIGIGGPVGCGKSMLIERVVPILAKNGYRISIISNDVISKEDADRMRQNLATNQGLLPENLVFGEYISCICSQVVVALIDMGLDSNRIRGKK